MLAAIVVLCVALALVAGAFARLWMLRAKWRREGPPAYSRPYRRWKDEDDR
jgi:hypothetical protein